jgi:hypothetical protein
MNRASCIDDRSYSLRRSPSPEVIPVIVLGAISQTASTELPTDSPAQQRRTTRNAKTKLSEIASCIPKTGFWSKPCGGSRLRRSPSLERSSSMIFGGKLHFCETQVQVRSKRLNHNTSQHCDRQHARGSGNGVIDPRCRSRIC